MSDNSQPWTPRSILALIIGGLILWAIYIAAGVIWYGLNPLGGVVVLVCAGIFIGFWMLLLRTQKDQNER
jgi:hypothetical protein